MNQPELDPRSPKEEYRTISLTQGQFAIVDVGDYEWLSQWKWYAKNNSDWRAYRHGPRDENYKQETIQMSRVIMNAQKGDIIDHVNHDGLDNRRHNLRKATHAENMRNKRKLRVGHSAFKGVTWHVRSQKWVAYITKDKRCIHLGMFTSEQDAAQAYRDAAIKYHGAFACSEAVYG